MAGDLIDLDERRFELTVEAGEGVKRLVRIFRRDTVERLSAAVNDVGLELAKSGEPTEAKLVCALADMLVRFNRGRK